MMATALTSSARSLEDGELMICLYMFVDGWMAATQLLFGGQFGRRMILLS